MLILGIETSCDETAAAVVEDGRRVRSNVLFSQEEIHGPFGGVVPELACRHHVIVIHQVAEKALDQAGVEVSDLSAIAVTQGPGLIGALLVGVCYAKGLAYQHQRPLLAVNHLEGHLAAIQLESGPPRRTGGTRPDFPWVALIVSGGHTHLYLVTRIGEYRLLGKTRDDAAGEAFDKAAKMLGLGYPGGPIIDRMAVGGDPTAIRFPRPKAGQACLPDRQGTFDFSFSGLKTSLKYHLDRNGHPTPTQMADIVAGFQQAIVDVLVSRCLAAARAYQARAIVVVGGVAANSVLRRTLEKKCDQEGVPVLIPPPAFCTDNGAMIAAAGYHLYRRAARTGRQKQFFLSLSPASHLPLGMSS